MSTDPRAQTDAQIAAILTREDLAKISEWMDDQQVFVPVSVIRQLFDSYSALVERLAEAERDTESALETAGLYEGQYGELYEVVDALGMDRESDESVIEKITDLRQKLAAAEAARDGIGHLAETTQRRYFDDARQRDAKLAAAQATIATLNEFLTVLIERGVVGYSEVDFYRKKSLATPDQEAAGER